MPKFSERYGYTNMEEAFQRETINDHLRLKLWNTLNVIVWDGHQRYSGDGNSRTAKIDDLVARMWLHYFSWDYDDLERWPLTYNFKGGAYKRLKEYFSICKWYEAFDFIEFIAQDRSELLNDNAISAINNILEQNNSAYRIVDKLVTEITDPQEIAAIEDGLKDSSGVIRKHLDSALRMLSDRENPDYRNSIKESISAVEAACRITSGKPKATLHDALARIKNVHPALNKAFVALYGYTGDEDGIRHAMIEEATVTYADAKFMLVTCAAFISYLKLSASGAE